MTNIVEQLPAYPYVQWNSDPDIVAFFKAYNVLAQQYLDLITSYQLPIYYQQSGALLDWCVSSIYGVVRPNLSSGSPRNVGPLNSAVINTQVFNGFKTEQNASTYIAGDEEYKRITQWNTFKGDGYQFSIRWLKRRVQRFLSGDLFPDQTYQVSVRFASETDVLIVISSAIRSFLGGAFYNAKTWGANTGFNSADTSAVVVTSIDYAEPLLAAIQSGAVLLPFQYTFSVEIS